jgi:hypothetical protein
VLEPVCITLQAYVEMAWVLASAVVVLQAAAEPVAMLLASVVMLQAVEAEEEQESCYQQEVVQKAPVRTPAASAG